MVSIVSFWVETKVGLDVLDVSRPMPNIFCPLLPGVDATNLAASPFAVTPQAGQPQDFNKLLKAERDHLELAEGMHKWIGDDVETRILKRYGRL
jgi:hypothetical protein